MEPAQKSGLTDGRVTASFLSLSDCGHGEGGIEGKGRAGDAPRRVKGSHVFRLYRTQHENTHIHTHSVDDRVVNNSVRAPCR